jgi:hypothetical protein
MIRRGGITKQYLIFVATPWGPWLKCVRPLSLVGKVAMATISSSLLGSTHFSLQRARKYFRDGF